MAPQSKLLSVAQIRENLDGNKLDLSMSGCTEVPVKEIAALKKATVLDLSNNKLTLLPPSFSSLTHLVELDLSKNELRELPESFGNLVNLKRLDLYENQLTHLPLSFCHLKALRWLDLKNNPLVPMLAEIAGPCGDTQQCQQCARNIVATMTKTAIKVEEDRKRLLEEKLREQEQIEQELLKKKEMEGESKRKNKKKAQKGKAGKEGIDSSESNKNALSDKPLQKATTEIAKTGRASGNAKSSSGLISGILKLVFRLILLSVITVTFVVTSCILFAAYDRKLFLQITEEYGIASSDVTGFVLYCAKYIEHASKHPFLKEMRFQLAACFRSILASVLNIYKTVCQEFPVYYEFVMSKVKV